MTAEVNLVNEPYIQEEIIGPDEAVKYLANSNPNRHVREGVVIQYARDMKKGRWFPSLIRFLGNGNLWDGQHRLRAVIVSKTAQKFWVERNSSPEAIRSVDTGVKRTIGDALAINGETHTAALASAIRIASHLETFPGMTPSAWSKVPFSPDEVFAYLDKNPDIRHSVQFAQNRLIRYFPYPPSLAAALHYLEMKASRPYAIDFWEQLASGADMKVETGPFVLRKMVFEDKLKPRGTQWDQNMRTALSIKAWNYWQQDAPVKMLRWHRGANEPFPFLGQRVNVKKATEEEESSEDNS